MGLHRGYEDSTLPLLPLDPVSCHSLFWLHSDPEHEPDQTQRYVTCSCVLFLFWGQGLIYSRLISNLLHCSWEWLTPNPPVSPNAGITMSATIPCSSGARSPGIHAFKEKHSTNWATPPAQFYHFPHQKKIWSDKKTNGKWLGILQVLNIIIK